MRKITFAFLAFALAATPLSAATLQVTSASTDAQTEGSLPNILSRIPIATATNIEFNLDNESIDFPTTGIVIDNKIISFDGINKKTGKAITIHGGGKFLSIGANASITAKSIYFSGFNTIFSISDNASLSLSSCRFTESGIANGAIIDMKGDALNIDKCLFAENSAEAISISSASSIRITNSSFVHNMAQRGAALNFVSSDSKVTKFYFANCTFANNKTASAGSAVNFATSQPISPVFVNCSIIGNLTESNQGSAIYFTPNGEASSSPVFINDLFAQNFCDASNPALACDGNISASQEGMLKATYANNLFAASDNIQDQSTDKGNTIVDFTSADIFKATTFNPWNNNNDSFMSCSLVGDLMVPMISSNSAAKGQGVASYQSYEIPATDQLGNIRSTTAPSIGAVENIGTTEIDDINDPGVPLIVWSDGQAIYTEGIEDATVISVYDTSGTNVYHGLINDSTPAQVNNLSSGLYVAKVKKNALKFFTK